MRSALLISILGALSGCAEGTHDGKACLDIPAEQTECATKSSLKPENLYVHSELAPLWWTSRKGLFSSEFRQCSREKIVQIHSRKTLSGA